MAIMDPHSDAQPFIAAALDASRASDVQLTYAGHSIFGPGLAAVRYRLPNGLTLLVVPDDRAPIFAYQTWFRVGSKDEDPQRTGLAHLFEHLMFKGTRKYASGVFDREMEKRGAQTNAATWVDWTYYTQSLSTRGDNLATVIDFEADRMTGLVLDAQTFASELEVVKNERRMSVDDSVPGTLSEQLVALAFTKHPYRWPTIGSMQHLEAASLADLELFYRTHYAPNNATVVLVGHVELVPALTMLARGYGALAAQPPVRRGPWSEPAQLTSRHKVIRRQLLAPQMVVGYHAPAQNDPAFIALEVLAETLVSGDTARLYNRLVTHEGIATDVGGFLSPFAEPGLFEFHITARPDVDPQRILAILQEELDAIQQGLRPAELNKARHGLELARLESLKDVEGCAEALGHFETNYGDFSLALTRGDAYAQITEPMLRQAAAATFKITQRNTVLALPSEGQS